MTIATDIEAGALPLPGGKSRRYPPCVFMEPDDIINLKRAEVFADRDEKVIRSWCKEFGIGRQVKPGSPIEISLPALHMLLHGDFYALEIFRDGDRDHPAVARHLRYLGLPISRRKPI